jgi:hypothetical protein
MVNATIPPPTPVEPLTPPLVGGFLSVPSTLQAAEEVREAESSPSAGEVLSPSAAQPAGETRPDDVAVITTTQAMPPQRKETTPARRPRTVIIKRGDSVWKLATVNYGFVDEQLLKRIKAQNPHLKSLAGLAVGDKLVLPVFEDMPAPASTVDLARGSLAPIPRLEQTIR